MAAFLKTSREKLEARARRHEKKRAAASKSDIELLERLLERKETLRWEHYRYLNRPELWEKRQQFLEAHEKYWHQHEKIFGKADSYRSREA
jgi:hypothetical protein